MAAALDGEGVPDPLCTYEEAARLLGVKSTRTVARYAADGLIARVSIGGGMRIVKLSIYEYKDRLAREALAKQRRGK